MARPERPLDPSAGPLQAFAYGLRELRRAAGNPQYRAMARAAGYSTSSLSAAAGGAMLPSLAVTLAYVGACGGDMAAWQARWEALSARQQAAIPRQLPMDVPAFTGRGDELSQMDTLLAATGRGAEWVPISAICGPGGVGKTTLAVHWAHRVARRFPDGQLYLDLRGYGADPPVAPGDALAVLLHGLGVGGAQLPSTLDGRAAMYRSLVAGRRILLILDNARNAPQIRPLLPGTPSCFVIVTSRDSLSGLVVRNGAQRMELGLLPPADAVVLLRALIGGRVEGEAEAAQALSEHCARLPLALRVAAELAVARPAAKLVELVEDLADLRRRLEVLDSQSDEDCATRVVFSWSYQNLPSTAARAFRFLGASPLTDFDAGALAALLGCEVRVATRALNILARAHLVMPSGTGRSGMHDLLAAYALECSDEDPERGAALARLLDHFLATASVAADLISPHDSLRRPRIAPPDIAAPADAASARRWLDAEKANLLAVVAFASREGWPRHAIELAATIGGYLYDGSHYDDAIAMHGNALHAALSIADRAGEALARHSIGMACTQLGRYDEAVGHYARALATRREIGDRQGEAATLNNFSAAEMLWGHYDEALALNAEALVIRRQIGDRSGEAVTLGNMATDYLHLHRYDEALAHFRRALLIHREVGHRVGEAFVLNGMGAALSSAGRYEESFDHLSGAMAIFEQICHRSGIGYVHDELGMTCAGLGRLDESIKHHQVALAIHRDTGYRVGEAESLDRLGLRYRQCRRYAEAAEHHLQSIATAHAIRNGGLETAAWTNLGETQLEAGRPGEARSALTRALALAQKIGNRYETTRARAALQRVPKTAGSWHSPEASGPPDSMPDDRKS
jgi:tetratricopeptide (TPR) repeat protein